MEQGVWGPQPTDTKGTVYVSGQKFLMLLVYLDLLHLFIYLFIYLLLLSRQHSVLISSGKISSHKHSYNDYMRIKFILEGGGGTFPATEIN